MATYSSEKVLLNAPVDVVYDKLSNLENLQGLLDKVPTGSIPEDKRPMFENIKITHDAIEIPGAPMGNMIFRLTEKKAPEYIRLNGEGIPIQMALVLHLSSAPDNKTYGKVEVDIDIPAMLKPMIGGQIQKIADQFGNVLGAVPFA